MKGKIFILHSPSFLLLHHPTLCEKMSDLSLEELLSPSWLQVLQPVIESQKPADLKRFLSKSRAWTIPSRPDTFAALKGHAEPHQWNVVILGQDPYPREESAVGIAFNDGAIKKVSWFLLHDPCWKDASWVKIFFNFDTFW